MQTVDHSEEVYDIVLASDQNYFIALRAAVVSLCHFNPNKKFRITILEKGISTEKIRKLDSKVKALSSGSCVQSINIDMDRFANYRGIRGSALCFARILIPTILKSKRALYLDCDLLILGDITSLLEADIEGKYAAVVMDLGCCHLSQDYPMDGNVPDAPYFNSGVMMMNLELWREHNIKDKVMGIIDKFHDRLLFYDQSALNAALVHHLEYLEHKYNFTALNFDLREKDIRILHYLSGYNKPWECARVNEACLLWQIFYKSHVDSLPDKLRDYYLKIRYIRSVKDLIVVENKVFYKLNIFYLKIKSWLSKKESSQDMITQRLKSYADRRSVYEKNGRAKKEEHVLYLAHCLEKSKS